MAWTGAGGNYEHGADAAEYEERRYANFNNKWQPYTCSFELISTNSNIIPSSSPSEERGHAAPKPTKPEVFDPSKGGVHVRTRVFSLNNYFNALGTPREDFEHARTTQ